MKKTYTVVCQEWELSERGWGIRPDGYSLHLSEDSRTEYEKSYWARENKRNTGGIPNEYSRPSGTPYLIDIDAKTYKKLQKSTINGLRFSGPPAQIKEHKLPPVKKEHKLPPVKKTTN